MTVRNAVNSQQTENTHNDQLQELKVIVRRLPPDMKLDSFKQIVSPLPPCSAMWLAPPGGAVTHHSFSRVYIKFLSADDVVPFCQKFDGYVFLSKDGYEYPALVEFSPSQRVPRLRQTRSQHRHNRHGSLLDDADYKAFCSTYAAAAVATPAAVSGAMATVEETIQQLTALQLQREELARSRITPLVQYVRQLHQNRGQRRVRRAAATFKHSEEGAHKVRGHRGSRARANHANISEDRSLRKEKPVSSAKYCSTFGEAPKHDVKGYYKSKTEFSGRDKAKHSANDNKDTPDMISENVEQHPRESAKRFHRRERSQRGHGHTWSGSTPRVFHTSSNDGPSFDDDVTVGISTRKPGHRDYRSCGNQSSRRSNGSANKGYRRHHVSNRVENDGRSEVNFKPSEAHARNEAMDVSRSQNQSDVRQVDSGSRCGLNADCIRGERISNKTLVFRRSRH